MLSRWRQEDGRYKVNLDYLARPCETLTLENTPQTICKLPYYLILTHGFCTHPFLDRSHYVVLASLDVIV